jgi:hypothetical protein
VEIEGVGVAGSGVGVVGSGVGVGTGVELHPENSINTNPQNNTKPNPVE